MVRENFRDNRHDKLANEGERVLFLKLYIERRRNMKKLSDAAVGSTVKVVKLHGEGAVRRRIMDMGITKGVEIHIRKVAPLGDPMELNIRGYELSVRKADAEMIEVD